MLEISGLSKEIGGGRQLCVDGISVNKKGIYGILGDGESGVTAFLDIVTANTVPDAGKATVCGCDTVKQGCTVRSKVGFVPANMGFFSDDTVLETLDFVGIAKGVSKDRRFRQIKEAIELVGLEGLEKRLCSELTSHEKKLLGVAVAILGNPEILVLEEIMKAEVAENKEELGELIKLLGRHKTVLVSSSEPQDIESICDHFIIFSGGRCVLDLDSDEIRAKLDVVNEGIENNENNVVSISDVYRALTKEAGEENR